MKELVEYIVKSIVDKPDNVNVTVEDSDFGKLIKIKVDESDKGRIIGKQGKIIKAIRQVVSASATKNGGRSRVEIIE
ncbi:MAG: KH domain-containing protein [Elusimicrobia bacterium]|nr:KH domain-containing protein [Elusimicrobiota bacterium]